MITTGKLLNEFKIVVDLSKKCQMDGLIIVDGHEGIGKSRTARVIGNDVCELTGQKLGVDNIHFLVDDYIKASEEGDALHVNIMDESREILNIRRSNSGVNLQFTNWISECRRLRQIHIIVLSAVHDLDRFIAIHRMNLLINMVGFAYRDDEEYKLLRGVYNVYPPSGQLFERIIKKMKHGYYTYPKPAYSGMIKDVEPFTKAQLKAYEDKKAEKRKLKYKKSSMPSNKVMQQRNLALYRDVKVYKVPMIKLGERYGLDRTSIFKIVKEMEKNKIPLD